MFIDRGEAKGHIRNNHYDNNVNIEIEKKKILPPHRRSC